MTAMASAGRGFALPGRGRDEEPEWTVLATVGVALMLGLLVQATLAGATRSAEADGVSLSYPAKWTTVREPGAVLAARDLFGGASTARVSVHEVGTAGPADAGTAMAGWTVRLAERHLGFHVIDTRRESVNGRPAMQIEYVYVVAPSASAPVLMRGIDTVASSGGRSYALSFVAPAYRFEGLASRRLPRLSSTFRDILASWRLP